MEFEFLLHEVKLYEAVPGAKALESSPYCHIRTSGPYIVRCRRRLLYKSIGSFRATQLKAYYTYSHLWNQMDTYISAHNFPFCQLHPKLVIRHSSLLIIQSPLLYKFYNLKLFASENLEVLILDSLQRVSKWQMNSIPTTSHLFLIQPFFTMCITFEVSHFNMKLRFQST